MSPDVLSYVILIGMMLAFLSRMAWTLWRWHRARTTRIDAIGRATYDGSMFFVFVSMTLSHRDPSGSIVAPVTALGISGVLAVACVIARRRNPQKPADILTWHV